MGKGGQRSPTVITKRRMHVALRWSFRAKATLQGGPRKEGELANLIIGDRGGKERKIQGLRAQKSKVVKKTNPGKKTSEIAERGGRKNIA